MRSIICNLIQVQLTSIIRRIFPIRALERLAPHKKSRNGAGEMFWEVDLRPHDRRKYLSPKLLR